MLWRDRMARWTLIVLMLSVLARPARPQSSAAEGPGDRTGHASDQNPLASNSDSATRTSAGETDAGNRLQMADSHPMSAAPRSSVNNGGAFSDNGSDSPDRPRPVRPMEATLAPPTDFQRLIAASLGKMLPIFGRDLFQNVPSTFAPLDQVATTADYAIGPGDELRIHVWGQVNFNANVTVDAAGAIYLPQIGSVHVAGLPFSALDAALREAAGRIFRNFDLSVEMGQLRSIQIFVVGQAQRPGAYTVSSLATLVNALFTSGGPSPEGSMRRIELKRGSQTVDTFDLYDLLLKGDTSKDVRLLAGDVIFIPPVGPQVAVAGSVRNPAIYELKAAPGKDVGPQSGALASLSRSDVSLLAVLELAGGRTSVAGDSRISIERIGGRRSQEAMEVGTDAAGLATAMEDGDLVRVVSLVPRLDRTVTVRGNLANPGNFAWHPGMRLSDLIPDRESLVTRNYWLRRRALGLPVPEFEADRRVDAAAVTASHTPGQAEASHSSLANAESQAATQNTVSAASTTDVSLSAPEIDWSYAVIERLDAATLTTSLLPFDLGQLVRDHDPNQNLVLEPGDVVTIFSQSDIRVPLEQQTKFVRLEGEFLRSGVYSVQPGETLRLLVARAGGLASNSYLYGSEFTRVSVRAVQQQRLDEYVQSLEVQIQRNQLSLSSNAVSAQESQTAAAASATQQSLLFRLRQLRATGRIVLESAPGSQTVASLPDLPLEDGDRFVVPPRPANINVVGAVYDQNSFLYSGVRRVGDYLKLAGGPTRDADAKRAFVIRADGSVFSRGSTANLWGNSFEAARLFPGDTVVVPEKVYKPSALRGFLDWSQVVSQFALGAAAINVVR